MLAPGRSRSEWGYGLSVHLAEANEEQTGGGKLQRASCPDLHRAHHTSRACEGITLFSILFLFYSVLFVSGSYLSSMWSHYCTMVFLRTVKQK